MGIFLERVQEASQIHWLEDHWRKARVGPTCFTLMPDVTEWPTLYIREGQAVCWDRVTWLAAANSAEALDEIAQRLKVTWEKPYVFNRLP